MGKRECIRPRGDDVRLYLEGGDKIRSRDASTICFCAESAAGPVGQDLPGCTDRGGAASTGEVDAFVPEEWGRHRHAGIAAFHEAVHACADSAIRGLARVPGLPRDALLHTAGRTPVPPGRTGCRISAAARIVAAGWHFCGISRGGYHAHRTWQGFPRWLNATSATGGRRPRRRRSRRPGVAWLRASMVPSSGTSAGWRRSPLATSRGHVIDRFDARRSRSGVGS